MPSGSEGKSPPDLFERLPICSVCCDKVWVRHKVPVGHRDFGEVFPCSCQTERIRIALAKHMLAASNLSHPNNPRTLEKFVVRPGAERALEAASNYCSPGHTAPFLTFTGAYGSGKSHLLEGIGRAFLTLGYSVRYDTCGDLLKRMRASFETGRQEEFSEVEARYNSYDLLLLDDLGGLDSQTPWGVGMISSLVDARYRTEHRLVVATNLTHRDVVRQFDPRVADRLWDVRTGIADVVPITCDSYRTKPT